MASRIDVAALRELAREVGVSHGAPRRHFPDRQALLDALAEAGYARLGAELRRAIDGAGEEFEARLQATAATYVRFATRDAALLELERGRRDRALPARITCGGLIGCPFPRPPFVSYATIPTRRKR